jgi:NlpC/P60 family putative phage cell wall peptidase
MNSQIVVEARSWIGTPYVHQASCKGAGADCLGLIRGIWRVVVGPEPEVVPSYTPDWGEISGQETLLEAGHRCFEGVSGKDALPGDILLFRMRRASVAKHLGIRSQMNGQPHFIHAYSAAGVIESALSDAWERRIAAVFRFPDKD